VGGFLADIDRNREYWRDCDGSIVSEILDYAAGAGFEELMSEIGLEEYESAQHYRQRHAMAMLKVMMKARSPW
jgi:hypothetical protein